MASQKTLVSAARGNFVLLVADSLRLLLPQEDVVALERIGSNLFPNSASGLFPYRPSEHVGQSAQAGHIGQVVPDGQIVALSERLRPLSVFPRERFLLCQLVGARQNLFLAWNEVRVLIDVELKPQPLPAVMQMPGAPIDAYVEQAGEVVLCSTAAQLLAYNRVTGG
jgi:hypothetical protein